ncbi:MAG TPA: VTT domain-containing protein [Paracoccaceae bacterium]|nr:VTT domain-containing protein [Paracoccaceae bacterium]
MTEDLLALVADWGAWIVLASTFLSCLALPVPSSLVMLAAGAFVGSGDLSALTVVAAAFGGAVAGDQLGWWVGRVAGGRALPRLTARPGPRRMLGQARAALEARGWVTVYLTRWLFSPLGPYVNLLTGAAGMGWWRFTLADLAGEATWVAVYIGLGWAFAGQVAALGATLGNLTGALTAGVVAVLLGRRLLRRRA